MEGRDGQWSAKCPAHDDCHNSLSVSVGEDGRVLLYCHAGCPAEAVTAELGLQIKDLFVEHPPERSGVKSQVVATYDYRDDAGNLLAQKIRKANKSFIWRRPDGKGSWIYNRQGVPHRLYVAGNLDGVIYVVEGEKDADNFHTQLGPCAVSGADGAGPGKWLPEYTEQLRDRPIVILQDNDNVGRAYAQETAAALYGTVKSIRLVDLSQCWPEIPEHGDLSDMIAALGKIETAKRLVKLEKETPLWKPGTPDTDPLLSLFKPLEDFPEEDARWLVEGWIPEGQISAIAADGGVGKTSFWCHVIAALSNGTTCILDPPGIIREPLKIMFLTTEDSVRKKLKKKLRLAGANMANIITPDFVRDRAGLLHKLKFGSGELEKVLRFYHPALCIFDPIQGFTPPKANMASRNEMRDCLAPLTAIGEETGTTSLIVCHTNKRKGASGRERVADSADIWDIARSVLMAGYTDEQGVRYLSNEKNNYAPLQETVLFTIDGNEQIHKVGNSWKRDRDYILGSENTRSAPKREDCKAFILQTLDEAGGTLPTKSLEDTAHNAGYAFKTIRNAKDELKQEKMVDYFSTGSAKGGSRVWHIHTLTNGFVDVPADEPTPFDKPVAV